MAAPICSSPTLRGTGLSNRGGYTDMGTQTTSIQEELAAFQRTAELTRVLYLKALAQLKELGLTIEDERITKDGMLGMVRVKWNYGSREIVKKMKFHIGSPKSTESRTFPIFIYSYELDALNAFFLSKGLSTYMPIFEPGAESKHEILEVRLGRDGEYWAWLSINVS